jgi:hypothetical protein
MNDYTQGRELAQEVLNESHNANYDLMLRFLILTSYLLEKDEINGEKELLSFVSYYRNRVQGSKINRNHWPLRGLSKVINKDDTSFRTRFIL